MERDLEILKFNKMLVDGVTNIDDIAYVLTQATTTLSSISKTQITNSIQSMNLNNIANYSQSFYNSNGVYKQFVDYAAGLFLYNYFVTPYMNKEIKNVDKFNNNFYSVLDFLDTINFKTIFHEITKTILIKGQYYAYTGIASSGIVLQALPNSYCRVRYQKN